MGIYVHYLYYNLMSFYVQLQYAHFCYQMCKQMKFIGMVQEKCVGNVRFKCQVTAGQPTPLPPKDQLYWICRVYILIFFLITYIDRNLVVCLSLSQNILFLMFTGSTVKNVGQWAPWGFIYESLNVK